MADKTGKRLTAKTALFFLVAASTWAFFPGSDAVLANASSSSTALFSSECTDVAKACVADSTCSACFPTSNDDDIFDAGVDEDCEAGYLSGSPSDSCLEFGAHLCCVDAWNDSDCLSNAEVRAVLVCSMESLDTCSADDLPCYDGSTGVVLASGSVALFKQGPILTAKVAVAGTLGLVVAFSTLVV